MIFTKKLFATRFLLGFLTLIAAQASAGAASVPPLHLLLTSFDPFGGSSVNNTQAIAKDLQANAAELGNDVVVDICNLPVVYDEAARVASGCVSQYKPDVVVSFGEADCTLLLETVATNRDNTPDLRDNAGNLRTDHVIVPGGPKAVTFKFPVGAMYSGITSSAVPVEVSNDMGAFVCNNTAYHLSRQLAPKKIPYTFIHVPNSRCSNGGDPAASAATIAQMLGSAIRNMRSSPKTWF